MKIFTTFILVLSFVISGLQSNAQESNKVSKEQQIKDQKIAFFTDKIGLTPEEAEKFWPIYNEYWEKKNKIYVERKKTMNNYTKNINNLSKDQLKKLSDKYISFETRE